MDILQYLWFSRLLTCGGAIMMLKPLEIYAKVHAMAKRLNGTLCISMGKVPHILVRCGSVRVSVCYFSHTDTWRIFYPYPSAKQTKITCKTEASVELCINDLKQ